MKSNRVGHSKQKIKPANERQKPVKKVEEEEMGSDVEEDDGSDLDFDDIEQQSGTRTKSARKNGTDDQAEDDSEIDSDEEMDAASHQRTLERLQRKDPEFYQYLQQHDRELLAFNADDDDDEEEDLEEDPAQEEETASMPEEKVTLARVEQWRSVLQGTTANKADCLTAIRSLVRAFRLAVAQTTDSERTNVRDWLSSAQLFNAVINTALTDLLPAMLRFLRMQNILNNKADQQQEEQEQLIETGQSTQFYDPRRSRNWKRLLGSVKIYLTDVLKMMDALGLEARVSFERHCLELIPFFNAFPHLTKRLIKRTIGEWSSITTAADQQKDDQRHRVLAFLILHRLIRAIAANDHLNRCERQALISQLLRRLYLSYVTVAKSTNEFTLAQIGFMKNSLAELYQLADAQLAYQHAFIFLRQLAINLRKSELTKQKVGVGVIFEMLLLTLPLLIISTIGCTETCLQLAVCALAATVVVFGGCRLPKTNPNLWASVGSCRQHHITNSQVGVLISFFP